jgi:hypothetical protein
VHRRLIFAASMASATRRSTRGARNTAAWVDGQAEWQRIVYALPRPEPLVSVIIPTGDGPELLRICTDGVLNQRLWPDRVAHRG